MSQIVISIGINFDACMCSWETMNPSGIEPELYPSQGYVLSIERWIHHREIGCILPKNILCDIQQYKSQTTLLYMNFV